VSLREHWRVKRYIEWKVEVKPQIGQQNSQGHIENGEEHGKKNEKGAGFGLATLG